MKKIALILASSILIFSGCATTPTDDKPRGVAALQGDKRLGEQVDKICFNRSIDGFSATTKDTVVLKRGVSDEYLVEVFGICRDLDRAQSIGIASRQSCLSANDSLIVSTSAFSLNDGTGIGPDRCRINRIFKWDAKALDEAEL